MEPAYTANGRTSVGIGSKVPVADLDVTCYNGLLIIRSSFRRLGFGKHELPKYGFGCQEAVNDRV